MNKRPIKLSGICINRLFCINSKTDVKIIRHLIKKLITSPTNFSDFALLECTSENQWPLFGLQLLRLGNLA